MKPKLHFPIFTLARSETSVQNVARTRGIAIEFDFDIDVSYNLIIMKEVNYYINDLGFGHYVNGSWDIDHIVKLAINYKEGKELLDGIPVPDVYIKDINQIKFFYDNSLNYDCVLFSLFYRYTFLTLYTALLIKKNNPDIDIIIGGPDVNLSQHTFDLFNILDIFDYVIKGDIEEAVKRYLTRSLKKSDEVYFDLKRYPVPIYKIDELKTNSYNMMIDTSRGCPFICSFCPCSMMKFRSVGLDRLAQVFKYYKMFKKFMDFEMYFNDNTVNYSVKRTKDLLQMMIDVGNNMRTFGHFVFKNFDISLIDQFKKAKFTRLNFGVDAIHEDKRKAFQKTKIKDNYIEILKELYNQGFDVRMSYIYNSPGETREVFEYEFEHIKRIRQLMPDKKRLLIYMYLYGQNPGSVMYNHPDDYGITYEYWEPLNCSDEINEIVTKIPKRYYFDVNQEEKIRRYKEVTEWDTYYAYPRFDHILNIRR